MAYSVTSATRTAFPKVVVGGITLANVTGATISFSLESPVPMATIEVGGVLPAWITRGMSFYAVFESRLFTGKIKRRSHRLGNGVLEAVGKTQKLWRPFKTIPWEFTNITADAAVEEILDDLGVTDRSIDMEAWTMGTAKTAMLDLTTPGDAIQKIIDVDGHRMFELPSGTLVIRPLLESPASGTFRNYTTSGSAPWVDDVSDDEDEDQVKKKVYVSGAVIDGYDAEGNEIQTQIKAEALTEDDSLVAGDPELYSMNYQSDLIQLSVKAGTVALRLVDKHHRIVERIKARVPLDPDIRLAMTLGFDDPSVTDKSVRWFVTGYTHRWSATECITELDLSGGDQSGTQGKLAPLADFIYDMDKELIGVTLLVLVYFTSTSMDLDGTIASYLWTDDYTPDPMNETTEEVTRVYDPALQSTINVTLQVTDDDGLTRSVTKEIEIGEPGLESMIVPQIAVAAFAGSGEAQFTPDGAMTWLDQGGLSGNTISVGAAEYGGPNEYGAILLGTDTGLIYRSTDWLQTAPTLVFTEVEGSPINFIWWDTNVINRVWACTQNGRLYWSIGGASGTWTLYHDFGGSYPLNRIGTPSGPDVVFVFGGRADQPSTLIQWNWLDNSSSWWSPDMTNFVVGAQAETVQEAAANVSPELAIIFTGGRDPAIMYTVDLYALPVVWQDATGLDAGLVNGRLLMSNSGSAGDFMAAFDDKEFWITSDGVAYITSRDRLSAPSQPTLTEVSGGLAAATYTYQVTAINDLGETLPSPTNAIAIAINKGVQVDWSSVAGATGYRVYGRVAGSLGLLVTVGDVNTWTDTGAAAVGVAPPTENTTSWVLPGTTANEPYHGMNVLGIPNLFYGASVEGIWKTYDKAITMNFVRPAAGISTWPASADGRMVSFVAQAAEVNQEPGEVYTISNNKLYKLNGVFWQEVNAALGAGAKRLRFLGSTLFYMNDAGLNRSADYGVTFALELADGVSVTKSPAGTLWATTVDTAEAAKSKIWKSIDDGLNWTLSYTVVRAPGAGLQTRLNSIDVNPNNSQYIAACGSRISGTSGGRQLVVSMDGGASWTEYDDFVSNFAGSHRNMNIRWGQSSRLIVTHKAVTVISVSDDFGVTWVTKYTTGDGGGVTTAFLERAGMWLWAGKPGADDNENLIRSNTNGESWEVFTPGQEGHAGVAYHPDGERLYCGVTAPGTVADVDRLKPMTDAAPEDTRTVLQYDWATVVGAQSTPEQPVAVEVT